MSELSRQFMELFDRRVGTCLRQPNRTLDLEGINRERLRKKKASRPGYAAAVTAKLNEITGLLMDGRNLQEVTEKLAYVEVTFEKFRNAHHDYTSEIQDAEEFVECHRYLCKEERKFNARRRQIVDSISETEEKLLAASHQVDSEVKPEDSVSCAGMHTPSRTSKTSRHSSQTSSRGSRTSTSSVTLARAKEAAKVAELEAEKRMLEKRQALEEKKFRLKQEESRLNLEAEIAKTTVKERAFAAMTTPELKPTKLEYKFNDQEDASPVLANKSARERISHHDNLGHPRPCSLPDISQDFTAYDTVNLETITLQRQQTALHVQQNRIVELLAVNQNRSKLPQPHVPVFDGDPINYRTFIRAFESLIESRTVSSVDRMYYLEQYTLGDVKELVRSCHHLPPDEGYDEARRLLKKKFGD